MTPNQQITQTPTPQDIETVRETLEARNRLRLTSRQFSGRETDWPLRSPFVTTAKRGVMV